MTTHRFAPTRTGARVGLMSLTAVAAAAGMATNAQAGNLYWNPPTTVTGTAGTGASIYTDFNGNWWDGATGTDPGHSSYWSTSWSPGNGTLPWTQGSDVQFPNQYFTAQYKANLTIYGDVQAHSLNGSGILTGFTISGNSASDKLTIGAGGFNVATTATISSQVELGVANVPIIGYQFHIDGPITDGNNGYGLSYESDSNQTHTTGSFNGLFLNGVNTYTGATSLRVGKIVLGANGSIAASSGVNFTGAGTWLSGKEVARFDAAAQDGATVKSLNGTGTVLASSDKGNGGLIVSDHLTPGTASSTGTLAFVGGDLTVGDGVTYNYLVGGSGATLASDLVDISGTHLDSNSNTVVANPNGTVEFAGNWTVALSAIGTVDPSAQDLVLFQLGNSNTVDLGNWSIDPGSTGWNAGALEIAQKGNQIVLTSVPEPASAALLGLAGLLVLPRRRREVEA